LPCISTGPLQQVSQQGDCLGVSWHLGEYELGVQMPL
jgi:hypothetical protein